MKVSVCITVLNEERSISRLLKSLLEQSKKPAEIVIVDGGSTDRTIEIIHHWQKKDRRIKLLIEKCARARGRNLGIEIAKNDILAITDADCVASADWLKRISEPFNDKEADIVAGFYKMVVKGSSQRALSIFMGTTPSKFKKDFLPSTRSMAFTRAAFDRVGGFPERRGNSAEDTEFNYKAVKLGLNFTRVKNATVGWRIPQISVGLRKLHAYAKWDAQSGIWWHPTKKLTSHNIKILFIFLRYFIGLFLLIKAVGNPLLLYVILAGIILYIFWAFRKVYIVTKNIKAALWGIIVQFSSDFAVMVGFAAGLLKI